MELFEACQTYFSDGGSAAIRKLTILEYPSGMPDFEDEFEPYEVNVRIEFNDETVSDWKVTREVDGPVLDAYCFNDVIGL